MKLKCLLLIMLVFASENENIFESEKEFGGQNEPELVVVKIEEDEYAKVNKKSNYFGVSYQKRDAMWTAYRWSKHEYKNLNNGTYKDEKMAAYASDTLARKLIANGEKGHKLNFPDDDTEVYREKRSKFLGISYHAKYSTWRAERRSKLNEKKLVFNGYYKDEETSAHASDTLARELIANGEKGHKLNFPDDDTEVHPKEKASKYIGLAYIKQKETWRATRWSKYLNRCVYNGKYGDEETAAHASDTIARKLIANGEKGHKLNFPDDDTKVRQKEVNYNENQTAWNRQKKSSKYIGVGYQQRDSMWCTVRWSKRDYKTVNNGVYKDEETAARASDTLARKLIANGEKGHKLNFPDDDTEVYPEESISQKKKRKRPNTLGNSQNNKSYKNKI